MNSPKPAATLLLASIVIGIGGGVSYTIGANQAANATTGLYASSTEGLGPIILGAILLVGAALLFAAGVYRIVDAYDGYMKWKWETEIKPKPAVRPTIKTD